jgi:hypothetical protein
MTILSFPTPTYQGQTFLAQNGIIYTWDGEKWTVEGAQVGGTGYILPPASNSRLGGVKVGTNINVDGNGVISIPNQTQVDWSEDNATSIDYIKNKPTDLGDFTNNAEYALLTDLTWNNIASPPNFAVLPSSTAGYLYNNGSGTLSWSTPAGGGATTIETLGDVAVNLSTLVPWQTLVYDGMFWVNGYTDKLSKNGHTVSLDTTGNLTIPGDIKSAAGVGDVVIEANNGTLRTWNFGGDGMLTLPAGASISNGANSLSIQPVSTSGEGAVFQISAGMSTDNIGGDLRLWAGMGADPGMFGSVDILGNVTVIRNELGQWEFGTDGNLTFPNGASIGSSGSLSGIPMTTTRGSILIGNQAECLGGENHFHIMKEDASAVDLFLGDDYNYVKLPGDGETAYGVEIGTNGPGGANTWRFGTDGSTTFPDNRILQVTDSSLGVQTSKTVITDNIWTVGSGISTNIDEGNGVVPGWGQRNPQEIEIDLFTAAAPLFSTLPNLALGSTVIVTYSTAGSNATYTGLLSQQFTIVSNYGSQVRLSGRINGTLPVGQTGIVSINFPEYSTQNSVWTFGTDGNLTFPNSTVIGTLSTGTSGIVAPIDTTFVVETNKSSVTTATSIINPGTGATPSNSTGTAGVRYVLGGPGGAGVGMQVRFTSGGYAGGQILNPTDIEIIDPGTGYQTGDQLTILNGNNDCSFTIQVTPQFNNTWAFGADGSLTLPGDLHGAEIFAPSPNGPISAGHQLNITPASNATDKKFEFAINQNSSGVFQNAALQLPTSENNKQVYLSFPGHDSGDSSSSIVSLWNQNTNSGSGEFNNAFNILANGKDIKLTAEARNGSYSTWTFDSTGTLTFPNGDLTIGHDPYGAPAIIGAAGKNIGLVASGVGDGYEVGSSLIWVDSITEPTKMAGVSANNPLFAGAGDVGIVTGDYFYTGTTNVWNFGADGDLTLPPGGVITGIGLAAVLIKAPVGSQAVLTNNSNYNAVVAQDQDVRIVTSPDSVLIQHTWNFGTDGTTTFPGAEGFRATFGDVFPIGDVLHSINDLVLKSDHGVTIVSGEGIGELEMLYNGELTLLTSLLSAELYGTTFLPASHDSIIALARAKAINPLISDEIITVAQSVSDAWDAWQEALNTSGIDIGVGDHGWHFSSNGALTLPGGGEIGKTQAELLTISGGNVTVLNQIYTKVNDNTYLGSDGCYVFRDENTGGYWRLREVSTDIYQSPDLLTWTVFTYAGQGGSSPAPTGVLSRETTSTDITVNSNTWNFDKNGNLTLPGRVQGGPGGANSIDLSWDLTIGGGKLIRINPGSGGVASDKFWNFGPDGSILFPDLTVQTTAYEKVAVPITSKGTSGDHAGQVAFDSDYIYYCTASYDGDNNIWKRVALDATSWDNTPPPVTYTLTVNVSGSGNGIVTSSPAGIDAPSGSTSHVYTSGTIVTLTASAAGGSTFAGWSGPATGLAPATITVTSDVTVTATFDPDGSPPPPPLPPPPPTQYILSVHVEGSGTVTSSPGNISAMNSVDSSDVFDESTYVNLTASPDPGYDFVGWSGDFSSGSANTGVLMDNNYSATATFETTPPPPPPTLVSILIEPYDSFVSTGNNVDVQFTATGTYSDSSTVDITSTVTWSVYYEPEKINSHPISGTGLLSLLEGETSLFFIFAELNGITDSTYLNAA